MAQLRDNKKDSYDFEKAIVGKNIHSVLSKCPECMITGINIPLDRTCGNCGFTPTITYYDAQTINETMKLK